MVVGLTGGIASGKSLAADYFRALGVPIIDTDEIARQVVAPDQPAWHRLYAAFGPDYFAPDGHLNRAALAQRVFRDADARRTLEAITHPAIYAEVQRQLARLRQTPAPPALILVVVPLLFETDAAASFDATVLVTATVEQQRARLQDTRHYTRADADARLAAQWPLAQKIPLADYLLDNSGTPEHLRHQVLALTQRLLGRMKDEG